MKLALKYRGQQYNIYAIVCDDGSCPAFDFLEHVKQQNSASHKSLVNLLIRHADHGQIRNQKKSRPIKGRKRQIGRLFEFKSNQGDRLLYFYQQGQKTILIHGFHKGAPVRAEYKKAEGMRDQYLREVENGQS
jgi:hypothetical protein